MNYGESMLFYLVIGAAVAAAQVVTVRSTRTSMKFFTGIAAIVFWPLYLPMLLSRPTTETTKESSKAEPHDALSRAIEQVETELNEALAGLGGWAEGVLRERPHRLGELRAALIAQADRIRDMDALVTREMSAAERDDASTFDSDVMAGGSERCRRSQQARKENLSRLDTLRRRARGDLLGTLAWIRELVSMIHLAKFTGAPAARAEELVAQIAAAVESISSLSTTSEPSIDLTAHVPPVGDDFASAPITQGA